MMIQAVLSNPSHPEYGVATIPFPINLDGTPPQRQFVNACRKIFEKNLQKGLYKCKKLCYYTNANDNC